MEKVTLKNGKVLVGKTVVMEESGEVWVRLYNEDYPKGYEFDFENIVSWEA